MIKEIVKSLYEYFYRDEINANNVLLDHFKQQISDYDKQLLNQNIKEANVLGTISNQDVRNLLSKYCGNIYLSDMNYKTTSMTEAKRFTIDTRVSYRQWISESHDCDNFSFASMGYWSKGLWSFSYGIAWSMNHAFNIMVDNNNQVWIVEPQTNVYTKIEESQGDYTPLRLIIM